MTGVQTVRDIYDGPYKPVQASARAADCSGGTSTYSAMLSRPPVLLDPRQGDLGRNSTAPVKDALRSIRRDFDTRPVSMDFRHPAAVDRPKKSGASAARVIATAAEQGPSIPP